MSFFKKIKDRIGLGDDESKTQQQASADSAPAATSEPASEPAPAPSSVATEAAPASSAEGTVTGSGLTRMYTSRAGDRLEDLAAYFYGDPVHKQRLLDDNPFLREYDGLSLPGGLQIHVSEDASRGDTA